MYRPEKVQTGKHFSRYVQGGFLTKKRNERKTKGVKYSFKYELKKIKRRRQLVGQADSNPALPTIGLKKKNLRYLGLFVLSQTLYLFIQQFFFLFFFSRNH
jgi:hypothetical protein